MDIEAFIITNGRSTFEYVQKALQEQSVNIKITVIRDMKWIDAVNKCVKLCKSRFFIRVDDDMFLHPLYVEYVYNKIINYKRINRLTAYTCKLWEDWQSYIAGTVKVYQTARIKDMNGFRANIMGKIDKPFEADRRKKNFIVIKDDRSVVGVHGMGTWEEQENYRSLWLKNNSKIKYSRPKSYLRSQRKYKKTPYEQYLLAKNLRKLNKRNRSGFWKFMKGS